MVTAEQAREVVDVALVETDQQWLSSFGVDASLSTQQAELMEINHTIKLGCAHLDPSYKDDERSEVVDAREQFLKFLNIKPAMLDDLRAQHPALIPLDNFIGSLRVMDEFQLDVAHVIKNRMWSIGYAPDTIRKHLVNLQTLGLDAARVVNANPAVISLSPESIREKYENMTNLGLDAVRVISYIPTTLSYAPESLCEKVENFQALGLDAITIIHKLPSALTLAPESVRQKVAFLDRSIKLLQWQGSALELIGQYPAILGFNLQKLAVLRRIASKYLSEASRSVPVNKVRSALFMPLEKYILELSEQEADERSAQPSLHELYNRANVHRLDAATRRERALSVTTAGSLGRLGIMYREYRAA